MEQTKDIAEIKESKELLDLEHQKRLMAQVNEYVKSQMVVGIDYGAIEGVTSKKVLFKPGAEKLCAIFNLYPEYFKTKEIFDTKNQFFFFEFKCVLKHRKTNQKVAESIGSCNNREKAKMNAVAKTGDVYGQINTISKIAQKRAYISATLAATALSNNFSAIEIEDADEQPSTKQILACAACGKEIDQKVANYSAEKFGRLLCIVCQKK
jgi:hypothetical protein